MKKSAIWVCAALGVSIALIVVACTITQKHGPGVSIYETSVEIYPGTKISSADQKALDAVLENFNKSFYKIRTYDRGKLVKTQGSLEDALIPQTLVAEISKASLKGISDQCAALVSTSRPSSPPPGPAWVQPSPKELRVFKRLVSRVTPILQKYSYEQVANVVKSGGR